MATEIGLFEAMYSQRALRYIKPEPIPDELVRKVLDAGIRAPNGGTPKNRGNCLTSANIGRKTPTNRLIDVLCDTPIEPNGSTSFTPV